MTQNPIATLDDLPFDTKDDIISFVDATSDLLSLALASRAWTSMVIPNHIEYRELKIRVNRPEIWQHLATRADLTKNIRSVRIMTQRTKNKEQFPSTLTDVTEDVKANLPMQNPPPEVFTALSNFKSLRRFTWVGNAGSSVVPNSIFQILVGCQELQEVKLWQVSLPLDHLTPESSVWRLSSLKKLSLRGALWTSLNGFEDSFVSMLRNSPNLEDFSISYSTASSVFTSCHFPLLTKLYLYKEHSNSNPGQSALTGDLCIANFLIAHPTIEDLRWYPVALGLSIPNGFLPRLKHLRTDHRMAVTILRDPGLIQQRKMECISQISLGFNTMQLLRNISGSRLQELHIWRMDDELYQLGQVAALFPNIRTLVIPNFGSPFGHDNYSTLFHDCIDCLASFPALENILESSLWFGIQTLKGQEKLEAPLKLAMRCRKLKVLNHCSSSSSVDHNIIFERTGSEITWSVQVDHQDEV